MKFSSLQEYFYKLQTILFLLLLIPLLALIILVSEVSKRQPIADLTSEETAYAAGAICFLSVLINFVAALVFRRSIKKTTKEVGLSVKLDQYYSATLVRYSMGSISCLALVGGFFLSSHYVFTLMFGSVIILFFVTWPWPAKVCRDLKLKGDEKEMVLYKKHSL
jgi:ABC-type dipeptide/oligopeptide/nickel transport system permease subunit